jgi:transposase
LTPKGGQKMPGGGHIKRYSEAFKLHVIEDMEKNALSKPETVKKYGLNSASLINLWLKRYNKYHLIKRRVRIEMPNEKSPYDIIKELKKEKQELECILPPVNIVM